MTTPIVLVATWSDGLFVVAGESPDQEHSNQSVSGLTPDGQGGAFAIVNRRSLRRRAPDGVWSTIATTEVDPACCLGVGDVIYVGTEDARILRVGEDGEIEHLRGFDAVAGRETWFAGSAVVNGQRVGPPLGIRSITATADGAVLLANVHVGGIPRSTDGGATWQPTIDVHSDVHEVRAHPNRPGVVMAAAAIGLCTSRDGASLGTPNRRACMRRIALRSRLRAMTSSCPHRWTTSRSRGRFTDEGSMDRVRWSRLPAACPMDGRHCGHRLYRSARLGSRDRRQEGQPLPINRHGPQLVAPGFRPPAPEQRAHRLIVKDSGGAWTSFLLSRRRGTYNSCVWRVRAVSSAVEHRLYTPAVTGSIPVPPISTDDWVKRDSAR